MSKKKGKKSQPDNVISLRAWKNEKIRQKILGEESSKRQRLDEKTETDYNEREERMEAERKRDNELAKRMYGLGRRVEDRRRQEIKDKKKKKNVFYQKQLWSDD